MNCITFSSAIILSFFIIDGSSIIYRQSLQTPICRRPAIKNGRVRVRQRGRWVKFTCDPNFVLAGEKNAFCRFGKWDVELPKCVGTQCPKKNQPPVNGIMVPVFAGNVINFYCKPGYDRKGPDSVICEGKTWDNNMPTCIASNTKPKLFCDFEDEDLCNWNQDLNHDMDWIRDQFTTPTGFSMETGPKHDHTKGIGGNGHYMYLESSSRRVNDTARLISPIFDTTGNNTCLEFWYHMYGRTIGHLRAYMKKISESWPLDPYNAIFSKNGNQGDSWHRAYINLGVPTEDYQIVIEGARGNGYVSDIAIDDIRIIENCIYQDIITTTEETPLTTIDFKQIASCENRCGHRASSYLRELANFVICDCDELCFEAARCCPDFADFCFTTTTTVESETTIESNMTEAINTIKLLTISTNEKNVTTIPNVLFNSTVTLSAKVTAATTPKTTKATTRLSSAKPTSTTTQKSTTKLINPPTPTKSTTRPPLIILKPPATPIIYQKIIPTKIATIRTTVKSTTTLPINQTKFSDIADISNHHQLSEEHEDEALLPNIDSSLPIEEKKRLVEHFNGQKEYWDNNDMETNEISAAEVKVEFSQSQSDTATTNNRITIIAITSVTVFILLVAVVIPLFIKYKVYNRYIERRVNTRNNRNSQSDVRFLADNEELDFGLGDGYDEL